MTMILDGFPGLLGIQASYIAYFNRPADVNGRAYWELAVQAHQYQLSDLTTSFSKAQEYKDLYAGKSSSEVVSTVYQNLFNRAPEATGLKFWTQKLDSGAVSVDQVAYTVMTAAQNSDKTIIDNKVAAADYFTNQLADRGLGEKYSGTMLAQAKDWLSQVNDNPASLKAAELTVDNVIAANTGLVQAQMYTFKMGYDPATASPTVNAHIIKDFHFGTDGIHLVGKGGMLEQVKGPTYFFYDDFSYYGGRIDEASKDQYAVFDALFSTHDGWDSGQRNPLMYGESVLIAYEANGVQKTVLFVDDSTSGTDYSGQNGPGSAMWSVDADILIDLTGIVGLKIDSATHTVDGSFFI